MQFMYGASDEKFVKFRGLRESVEQSQNSQLNTHKFETTTLINGDEPFDRNDVTILLKVSPDYLLNLAARVVDQIPLPPVYEWTVEDVCRWIRRYGYPEYMNTFRVNLITGRKLVLVDAAALTKIGIQIFNHVKHIAYGIRMLFFFELTKYGRSISLDPNFHFELYKLFRSKSLGAVLDRIRPTDLWRKMGLLREAHKTLSTWDELSNHLKFVPELEYPELFGGFHRYNMYRCKTCEVARVETPVPIECHCMPPCECFWTSRNYRPPWRLQCLGGSRKHYDPTFVLNCPNCIPPCDCQWVQRQYLSFVVMTVLQKNFPHKYAYNDQKSRAALHVETIHLSMKHRGSL